MGNYQPLFGKGARAPLGECRPEIEPRVKEHFVGRKFVLVNLVARTQFPFSVKSSGIVLHIVEAEILFNCFRLIALI